MQIAQALRQTTKPFVSLEFFPPAAESHLPEFYETVERLRSIDPLFLSVTYGAGGGKQQNTLNVTAELARISPGPVITLFALRPAPGVKAGRFAPLSQDIAMSLKRERLGLERGPFPQRP